MTFSGVTNVTKGMKLPMSYEICVLIMYTGVKPFVFGSVHGSVHFVKLS